MSFYSSKIFPIINNSISRTFSQQKKKLLHDCHGEILEIGFGSGLSLEYYPDSVTSIVGLEPNEGMLHIARGNPDVARARRGVRIIAGSAESIPFPDLSFDAVVSIFTLCSVGDPKKVAKEISRVLRPGGKLFFLEHTVHQEGPTRWLQVKAQPIWEKLFCGCHIDRDSIQVIAKQDLEVKIMEVVGYSGFPNVVSPIYLGTATKSLN